MFAIEMFFDAAADRAVREVWRELGYKGIPTIAPGSDSHPHVTLGVYARIEQAACAERLAAFAARTDPFKLTLSNLGLFPPSEHEAVVFAGATVTSELLTLHGRVHGLLSDCTGDAHPYYAPGSWVPHCTLTQHCPTERVGEVITICRVLPLPLVCRIEAIGVIETNPVRLLSSHRLRGA